MRVCPRCGYEDNPLWRNSRFDWNSEYMEWDEAETQQELKVITDHLKDSENFKPFVEGPYAYYRRGSNGIYLYRVLVQDFKLHRERVRHDKGEDSA